jgi:hypothetical protein
MQSHFITDIMRECNISDDLKKLERFNKSYADLTVQSKKLIESFKTFLVSIRYTGDVVSEHNAVKFSLWGLNYLVKCEINYPEDMEPLREGLISVCISNQGCDTDRTRNEVVFPAILSWQFDTIGNVNNSHTCESFAKFFYRDLVATMPKYCKDNHIEIPLK